LRRVARPLQLGEARGDGHHRLGQLLRRRRDVLDAPPLARRQRLDEPQDFVAVHHGLARQRQRMLRLSRTVKSFATVLLVGDGGDDIFLGYPEYRHFLYAQRLARVVPEPLAARYRRYGLYYRAAIVVREVAGAETLAERIARAPGSIDWSAIGAVLARFHAAGVDHADLNAHNILLDAPGAVWLVDFDRGERRAPGPWADANIARLKRSLDKLGAGARVAEFEARAWRALLESWRGGLVA